MKVKDFIKEFNSSSCSRVRMNDKLTNIWLYAVAVAFTIAAFCTFAAWVVGLAICVMRWLNG